MEERVLLHLGWMDIDYAIRKEEPDPIIETSTAEGVVFMISGRGPIISP